MRSDLRIGEGMLRDGCLPFILVGTGALGV